MEPQQTPAFFVRGPSPMTRLVFFAALSVTLMATDARLHYLREVREGFMALIHPLQVAANVPVDMYRQTADYLTSHHQLYIDNQRLTRQSLEQGVALQKLRTLEAENAHLRNLLGASKSWNQQAQLAEIMHAGRDPFSHKIVVNLGTNQGVAAGQAVVDEAGVMGQITRVYPFSSEVTLVTDKELAIPVQVERNSLRAIAFGHGRDNTIDLPYLPANVDIRKGDKLITSGIDGVYPTGLAVAIVTSIERNPDSPFAKIICTPVAGIENYREVLVLAMPKPDAYQKAQPVADVPQQTPANAVPANANH
ncbi:MAG TPA: rod shape-determining protein MreC [Methylophilaceae bacterium]|nr:rod shape-determining protein MreC [Methylophilaceae bacterium]